MMFRYECKKFLNWKLFLCLLILLGISCTISFLRYKGVSQASDTAVSEELYREYGGELTEEKLKRIEELKEECDRVLAQETEMEGKYSRREIDADTYLAYREQYHDYYSRREAIEAFYERSLQAEENGTWLIFDSYYEELAGSMDMRPALFFAIALIAVLSVSCERKRLFRVLCVTKRGHKTLVRTKAGTVFACCAFLAILFYLKDLMLLASFSSFSYLEAPIQSISVLTSFPVQISLGVWLVFALIVSLILYGGMGTFLVWIQMNRLYGFW
ncbi:MAG: hypothetical protein LUI14_04565 [Lachnospiraceae bacterium]|nr:hypothetical protein [Lachnospiraceae bacterium]